MQPLVATAACVALLVSACAVRADGNAAAELLGVRINGIDQNSLVVVRRLAAHALAVPVDALAAWQLRLTHRQSVTNFEDALVSEYRELAASLPVQAFVQWAHGVIVLDLA